MSLSDKGGTDDAESLVETLTIDGTTLTEANLTGISCSEFQRLTELSQELTLATEMDTEEHEIIVTQDEMEHEEVVQTDLGAQEVEIETEIEQPKLLDEVLQDIKPKTTSLPPLRPLTIAPKPTKVPIAMKPVSGQQLLLVQGPSSNQTIKLLSPQGQELNLANFSLSRPVALKPAIKTSQGNISIVQQKPVVMKKIIPGGKTVQKGNTFGTKQIMVVQKSGEQAQQVKIVPSPTKTITLQQAQEMGLLTSTKIVPSGSGTTKQTVLLNKGQHKTIKIVPQPSLVTSTPKTVPLTQIRSPTKILPAVQSGGKVPQRIIFKAAGSGQTIIPSGQIIQVAGGQALNGGQLHQINIPGKGMQYIKLVTTSLADSSAGSLKTATNIVMADSKANVSTTSVTKQIRPTASKQIGVSGTQMVVLPSTNYTVPVPKVAIPMRHVPVATPKPAPPAETTSPSTDVNLESNGMRPRKPCNCNKSQCLKLYCDCFANGEFCYMCKCVNCFNNLENEDNRQRAIKACLDRNPNAFRPKIGKAKDTSGDLSIRKHTKGCNCKRSGCLKNYCECFEAKIACSNNCKCVGCRNIEDSVWKKNIRLASPEHNLNNIQAIAKVLQAKDSSSFRVRRSSNMGKTPINFITDDVIEATCHCMMTIYESAVDNMQDDELTSKQLIEEFGRCLTEIIGCTSNRNV